MLELDINQKINWKNSFSKSKILLNDETMKRLNDELLNDENQKYY